MKPSFQSWLHVGALSVLLSAVLAQPSYAAQWQELGNMPDSLDKIYIDTESAELEDGFRIVRLMIVYPSPRTDKNGKTADSYIQRTAIDCDKKTYYGIQTIWFLDGKPVIGSPSDADWKNRSMHHFTDSSLSQRLQTTACSLRIPTGKNPAGEAPSTSQSAAPARSPESLLEGENLLFAPPKNFNIGYHVDRNSMTEWVPNGQTVEDWTEMLTVQIFHDLKEVQPAAFLQNVGTRYLNACPGTPKDTIHTGTVNGYVVSMLELKCPMNPGTGKPETTVFRVIKGKDALYSVQYAWRKAPSEDASQALSKSTVCDTRDASHSCPSLNAPAPPSQPKPKFSTGSGIVVNTQGYVLTNAHVIKGCRSITVKLLNADALSAKLEAVDPKNDLALIKATGARGEPAQFRHESKPAKLGETIGVTGYPLNGILSSEPKATFGQINSVAGVGNDYTLLQISAPVQPGNSGGPVFDESGNVIGIVVSEVSPALIAQIGAIPQNVNFAIKGEVAQIFMQAHGVSFKIGDHKRKLRTDEIAATGQRSTAFILCSYE